MLSANDQSKMERAFTGAAKRCRGGGECQQTHSASCAWWWKPAASRENLPGVQVELQLGLVGSRVGMEKLHMGKFPRWVRRASRGLLSKSVFQGVSPPWEGVGLYPQVVLNPSMALNPPVALWSLQGQQDFSCLLSQPPFPMHNPTTSQATASLCLSPSQTNLN